MSDISRRQTSLPHRFHIPAKTLLPFFRQVLKRVAGRASVSVLLIEITKVYNPKFRHCTTKFFVVRLLNRKPKRLIDMEKLHHNNDAISVNIRLFTPKNVNNESSGTPEFLDRVSRCLSVYNIVKLCLNMHGYVRWRYLTEDAI